MMEHRQLRNQTEASTPGLRILVVDDDPGIRSLLGMALASEEWDVHMAHNGAEALAAVRANHRYDLVIMDLQMPVMDGRSAVRQLRAEGFNTPILLLSAYGARAAKQELSVEAAIDKPFDPLMLAERVRDLINAQMTRD